MHKFRSGKRTARIFHRHEAAVFFIGKRYAYFFSVTVFYSIFKDILYDLNASVNIAFYYTILEIINYKFRFDNIKFINILFLDFSDKLRNIKISVPDLKIKEIITGTFYKFLHKAFYLISLCIYTFSHLKLFFFILIYTLCKSL